MTKMTMIVVALASLALAGGCDTSSSNGDANNGAANNQQTNNTSANNTSANNTSANNTSTNNTSANNTSANNTSANNSTEPVEAVLPSNRPRVKFKGGARWSTDLSRGLALEREELCKELGKYDCVDVVHRITLGGVEPYSLGIDKPVDTAPVIAPLATDRVALSACDVRAERDLADLEQAVIFKEMPAEGRPEDAQLEAMSTRLVERLLHREARPDEVRAMAAFYDEVEADSDDPRRDWATLSCFALATSLEALFY